MAPEILNIYQIHRATGLNSAFQWKEKWLWGHYKNTSSAKRKQKYLQFLFVCLGSGCKHTKQPIQTATLMCTTILILALM